MSCTTSGRVIVGSVLVMPSNATTTGLALCAAGVVVLWEPCTGLVGGVGGVTITCGTWNNETQKFNNLYCSVWVKPNWYDSSTYNYTSSDWVFRVLLYI